MVSINPTSLPNVLGQHLDEARHSAAVVAHGAQVHQITPLCRLLSKEGFAVDLLRTDELLSQGSMSRPYQVVLFDLESFDDDGQIACSRLRTQNAHMPIMVLSCDNSVTDRIRGFDCGADDFIGKPYSSSELSARLRALLRRSGPAKPQNILRYHDLAVDLTSRVVRRGEHHIDLSRREFALLVFLMQNAEKVLGRQEILKNVWANSTSQEKSNVVDVYVNYLRNKTEQGQHDRLIQTIRGKGYMLHSKRAA